MSKVLALISRRVFISTASTRNSAANWRYVSACGQGVFPTEKCQRLQDSELWRTQHTFNTYCGSYLWWYLHRLQQNNAEKKRDWLVIVTSLNCLTDVYFLIPGLWHLRRYSSYFSYECMLANYRISLEAYGKFTGTICFGDPLPQIRILVSTTGAD